MPYSRGQFNDDRSMRLDFVSAFIMAYSDYTASLTDYYPLPSYITIEKKDEDEYSGSYVTQTSLDSVGIYLSEELVEEKMNPDIFKEYSYPDSYHNGVYVLPNYEISWITEENKLNLLQTINTSDADVSTAMTKIIDLTNDFASLETDKTYFLYIAPPESYSNVNVSYRGVSIDGTPRKAWVANQNLIDLVFDKWRRQLQIKAELSIEGYFNTDAFQ